MPESELLNLFNATFSKWHWTTTYNEQETTWNNLQRARNSLKQPTTTWNRQQLPRNDLKRPTMSNKRPETTYNDLQRATNDLERARNGLKQPTTSKKRPETTYNELKRPTTTYNKQETTWNDPQRVRHNLQWPEHTYNEQRKDAKRPTTSRFSDYFMIWSKWFSSPTRFLPNIWLQSFEHCFMENHGENRASSIYYYASRVNYHVYFLRDKRFIFSVYGSSVFVFIGEV